MLYEKCQNVYEINGLIWLMKAKEEAGVCVSCQASQAEAEFVLILFFKKDAETTQR